MFNCKLKLYKITENNDIIIVPTPHKYLYFFTKICYFITENLNSFS